MSNIVNFSNIGRASALCMKTDYCGLNIISEQGNLYTGITEEVIIKPDLIISSVAD
jgi:hypothetical protein